MRLAAVSKRAALALAALCIAGGAAAQTLDPTIRVHPVPQVEIVTPAPVVPVQCICTMQYDPVCARIRNGKETTYPNACQAQCAGATQVRRGAC